MQTIGVLEKLRVEFCGDEGQRPFGTASFSFLPSSYNQMRTCTMNYENIANMYFARRHHKLDEWHVFCAWAEELPYFKTLFIENDA